MHHSDPPLCVSHQRAPTVVSPSSEHIREAFDSYPRPIRQLQSIDDVIQDLFQRQSQLSSFIETQAVQGDVEIGDMAKLLGLLGQNASRIGRLLRDKRALSGEAADGLLGAISAALDEISTDLGIKL